MVEIVLCRTGFRLEIAPALRKGPGGGLSARATAIRPSHALAVKAIQEAEGVGEELALTICKKDLTGLA